MKYLLIVNFQPGAVDTPMDEWKPDEIEAHLDYYRALNRELQASGELVDTEILAGPDLAKVVTSDGINAPVVTDGPFQEFKEWVAGGRATEQPIIVRQIMEASPRTVPEIEGWLETARGAAR